MSEEIDKEAFAISLLQQPDLFIRSRINPEIVQKKLAEAGLNVLEQTDDCFRLSNGSSLQNLEKINKNYVVQDKNSQQVFNSLEKNDVAGNLQVWDCCAASGGKSILFNDKVSSKLKLTVTDIRKDILDICRKRLAEAEIKISELAVADLAGYNSWPMEKKYDVVICDAPCTGSGTWARTPEQLYFFKKEAAENYSSRQRKIAGEAIEHLKENGIFVYITCSVFQQENEVIVQELQQKKYHLIQQQYFTGYDQKADSLFVAVFKKQ